ncbi:MAG: dTMP kinase [Acetobacteraceae bacterium]|nr:dTMP kinase [Acetobacteraceae bacterium]
MEAGTERWPFITLEGIDGSGKSTQFVMLVKSLEAQGVPVVGSREPGGTPAGELLRGLLLDPATSLSAPAEALLYAAARAENVARVILPALLAGRVVVCDRFVDSSLAYQGRGLGLDLEWVRQVNRGAVQGLRPGLTLLFDIDPAQDLRRSDAGPAFTPDRIEARGEEFRRRVRRGYLELAAAEPERIKVVRVEGDAGQVHARVLGLVQGFLDGFKLGR